MNILLIGNGGRENAIAWKLSKSPNLSKLYILPGNPGTMIFGESINLDILDFSGIINLCYDKKIDIVIVGPEIPLAEGITDKLNNAGISVFGPSKNASLIESSKTFSKEFMTENNIPTAKFTKVLDFDSGKKFIQDSNFPVVIKASGLCAGKGVIIPETLEDAVKALDDIMNKKEFGAAGDEVIIEERLSGPEISLMAFSDGTTVKPMVPAQDHKRLLDGHKGPNTGGMGAYAPANICTEALIKKIMGTVIQPAVDGLRQMGSPFVGVLYAGLMLTDQGLMVLEFNCRFGDPETQVVLPLLESDLLEIVSACCKGKLDKINIKWNNQSSACVILTTGKYPYASSSGDGIDGINKVNNNNVEVFHAGTEIIDNQLVTNGGRVLGVTSWDDDLQSALNNAYQAINNIHFNGIHYRKDIGQQGLTNSAKSKASYSNAGVDIDAGKKSIELITQSVKSTHNENVLSSLSSFGGLFDISFLKNYEHPVLVSSTDGVGTKVKLAQQYGQYESIGKDIVNHCIDDILVQGAAPLFFMDYYASSKLDPPIFAKIVSGMSEACKESGLALLGGETAEMPGVYETNEFDIAGTIIGVVEKKHILPKNDIRSGDLLIGIKSSGPHTNGYSLIRKIFNTIPLGFTYPEIGVPLGEALLMPHRSYLNTVLPLIKDDHIKALIHITGGGFFDNIPRVLPDNTDAIIHKGHWPMPPLFNLIEKIGNVSNNEMYRVFNMGIGLILIVDPDNAKHIQNSIPEETWVIGKITSGSKKVYLDEH